MKKERNSGKMGMYALDELLTLWKHERVTEEQAIGHILQHLEAVYERLREVERRVKHIPSPEATSHANKTNAAS